MGVWLDICGSALIQKFGRGRGDMEELKVVYKRKVFQREVVSWWEKVLEFRGVAAGKGAVQMAGGVDEFKSGGGVKSMDGGIARAECRGGV